jgi:AcrR family transcriptional regulator
MSGKVTKILEVDDSSSGRASTAKGERVREGILDAARLMIERHGFAKLTLDDIAGYMGKRKGSLYYYYPDKSSILVAMFQRESDRVKAELAEAVSSARTGLGKLEAYLGAVFLALEQRMTLITVLNREVQDNEYSMLMPIVNEMRKLEVIERPLMEAFLQEGELDGSLRAMGDEERSAVASVLLLGLNGIAYAYMVGQTDVPPRRCFEIGCASLLQGLRPNGPDQARKVAASKSAGLGRADFTLEELDRGLVR